jgi:hypothetical protein
MRGQREADGQGDAARRPGNPFRIRPQASPRPDLFFHHLTCPVWTFVIVVIVVGRLRERPSGGLSGSRWSARRVQSRRECSMVPIFAATVSAEPWAYDESTASYVIRA